MKFETVEASAQHAEENLSDSEFIARMSVLEDGLEAAECEEELAQPTAAEIADNMETLNCWIKTGVIDDVSLEHMARTTPGLKEMYGDSLESFKTNLAKFCAANEGVVDGVIGDVNTGIIGAIIAICRNSLPAVKEQIQICENKLKNTTDEQIAKRTNQMLIRVRSKYLPDVGTYNNGVSALTKLCKTIASNPKADEKTLINTLKGSMFWNNALQKLQGNQDTNWKYAGIKSLGNFGDCIIPGMGIALKVAERFHFEPAQPIGQRGWDKREKFEAALKSLKTLVDAFDKASSKMQSGSPSDAAARLTRWAGKEVVYIGRGLTTAIRKMYAGNFVRYFSNRFIH